MPERRPFYRKLIDTYWLMSCVGAIVIGVTLPVLLVCWNCWRTGPLLPMDDDFASAGGPPLIVVLDRSAGLLFIATFCCGPGAVLLAVILHNVLSAMKGGEPHEIMRKGALLGAVLAFLNVPGFMAGALLHGDYVGFRLACLFLVSGATCGAWIAWQAYRSNNAAPLFPRYSLRTLLVIVFLWGLLLAIFAPQK
jgi:hypothetical protein